jgi:hypothetical protein
LNVKFPLRIYPFRMVNSRKITVTRIRTAENQTPKRLNTKLDIDSFLSSYSRLGRLFLNKYAEILCNLPLRPRQ